MVLWELTLATAYFLGLRRTYRLALKLQRRLLKRGRYPRLRDFAHRRTRNVFDIALSFHEKVQKQDVLAGRSLGNYILRLLDRMRPAANITGSTGSKNEADHQGKFPLPHLDADSKQAYREHVSRTDLGSKPSEGMKGTGRGSSITSQPINCSLFGLTIGRKITGGICGIKPGLKVRSLPELAFRLWWQPIRQNMEALHSKSMSSEIYLPLSLKIPPGHYHLKEFCHMPRMIIREDIARWMRL
eukprot:c24034_g1_i1 orf=216-944(+)